MRYSYFLEVAAIELNLDSSNPGTSMQTHMSNRINETFDSEYGIFRNMQCFMGTQKNRLNEKHVFVYSNTYFL